MYWKTRISSLQIEINIKYSAWNKGSNEKSRDPEGAKNNQKNTGHEGKQKDKDGYGVFETPFTT